MIALIFFLPFIPFVLSFLTVRLKVQNKLFLLQKKITSTIDPFQPGKESFFGNVSYSTMPSLFNMQAWNDLTCFYYYFGSKFKDQNSTLNGVYTQRKHYAYKIYLRMDNLQKNYLASTRIVGIDSRLFVESALSLFAPSSGWPKSNFMIGQQV